MEPSKSAGLLLLTEEEYGQFLKRATPISTSSCSSSPPLRERSKVESVLPSDSDQLRTQLRKLGLQEVPVRGSLVLAPVNSGKKFTSMKAQQKSISRIIRRVPCTRSLACSPHFSSPKQKKISQSAPASPIDKSTRLRKEARHLFSYASREAASQTREQKRQQTEANIRAELKSIKNKKDVGNSYLRTQDPRVLEEMQSLLSANYSASVFSPQNFEKSKHLDRKLFRGLSSDPAHFYRAAVSPQQAREHLTQELSQRPLSWDAQQEVLFKSALRGKQRMRATRKFLDLKRQHSECGNSIPKEWVRDRRSPYVHDPDFHSPHYYAFEETARKRHESPEVVASNEFDSKDLEDEQLQEITGLPASKPLYTRRKAAECAIAFRKFEQAQQAPKLLKQWKDRETMERHKANLSEDIINHLAGETRYVQKARYAYLSSKVAKQRALSEASQAVLQTAEQQRIDLYRRQVAFQRLVTTARAVVKRLYGESYSLRKRRPMSSTAFSLGHVNFPSQMQRLGLLGSARVKAEPVTHSMRSPVRVVSLDPHSSVNISNLTKEVSEKPPVAHPDHHYFAAKIQARFRCYIAHKRVTAMKIVVRFLKKNFRMRKLRRMFLTGIVLSRKRSRRLANLFVHLKDDPDMQAVLKASLTSNRVHGRCQQWLVTPMVRCKRSAQKVPIIIDLEGDSEEPKKRLAVRTSANYKCPGCNLTYVFKEGVLKHLKADHPSLRVDPNSITSRLSRPPDRRAEQFACHSCPKKFSQQSALQRHQRVEGHEQAQPASDTSELENYINSL